MFAPQGGGAHAKFFTKDRYLTLLIRATTTGLLDLSKFDVRDRASYTMLERAAIRELQLQEEKEAAQMLLDVKLSNVGVAKDPMEGLKQAQALVFRYLRRVNPHLELDDGQPKEVDIVKKWESHFGAVDSPENQAKLKWLDQWIAGRSKQIGL